VLIPFLFHWTDPWAVGAFKPQCLLPCMSVPDPSVPPPFLVAFRRRFPRFCFLWVFMGFFAPPTHKCSMGPSHPPPFFKFFFFFFQPPTHWCLSRKPGATPFSPLGGDVLGSPTRVVGIVPHSTSLLFTTSRPCPCRFFFSGGVFFCSVFLRSNVSLKCDVTNKVSTPSGPSPPLFPFPFPFVWSDALLVFGPFPFSERHITFTRLE